MIIEFLNPKNQQKLFIADSLLTQMTNTANKHFPKEFGGILTGIKEKDFWIITDFKTPANFKNSSSSFTRKVKKLNQYLAKIFRSSNGKLQYLGEWHTHPKGTTQNSKKDLVSMKEIANEPNVTTDKPIMIIFSLHPNKLKNQFKIYQYTNGALITLKKH